VLLEENNYIEKINALPVSAWKPLLDLIPEIRSADSFGETVYGQ